MLRYATFAMVGGLAATTAFAQERTTRVETETTTEYTADDYGPDQGSWELIIGGSGTNDQDFDTGSGNINVELGYYFLEPLEVGVRQQVGMLGGDDDWNFNGSTAVFADYHFDLGAFRPFIGASIGYLYGENVDETFIAGPEAGLKWYVKDETFIYGRVSYDFFFEDTDDADDAAEDGRFNYVLGVGFNF